MYPFVSTNILCLINNKYVMYKVKINFKTNDNFLIKEGGDMSTTVYLPFGPRSMKDDNKMDQKPFIQ